MRIRQAAAFAFNEAGNWLTFSETLQLGGDGGRGWQPKNVKTQIIAVKRALLLRLSGKIKPLVNIYYLIPVPVDTNKIGDQYSRIDYGIG